MNRIYRLIYNRARGLIQVVSELGSVEGRHGGTSKKPAGKGKWTRETSAIAVAAALVLSLALPLLATVPADAATTALRTSTGKGGGGGGNGGGTTGGTGGAGTATNTSYANAGGTGGDSSTAPSAGGSGGAGYGPGGMGGVVVGNHPNYEGGGGGGGGGAPGDTLPGSGSYQLSSGSNITGGSGGSGGTGAWYGNGGNGGNGGAGIFGSGFTLNNASTFAGTITGGRGGTGGSSGTDYSGPNGNGGNGGAGIAGSGFTATNAGNITGGSGGTGAYADYGSGGNGGNGGAGIAGSGFALTNVGTITGGAGGSAGGSVGRLYGSGGSGGVGVVSTGNSTIVDSGTIAGGVGNGGSGARADAVDFSGGGNTLELLFGSALTGNVVSASSTANGGDTLELGGSTSAALSGTFSASTPTGYTTGSPVFSGFTTLLKTGTSTWTITGASGTTPNAISNWSVQGGILKVSGNFNPLSTDTLTIGVQPTSGATATPGVDYGQLLVSGTANLNSERLTLDVNSGTYTVGTQYDIVHAGTLSGTFGGVTYNSAFAAYITPKLSYGANDVYVRLAPTRKAFTGGQGVADDGWAGVNALSNAQEIALNAQGGAAGGILTVHGRPDPAVWVRGLTGTGGAYGASLDSDAVLIGGGDEIRHGLIIGAAFGHTETRTRTSVQKVHTHSDGLYLYGLYNHGPWFVGGTATGGALKTRSERSLPPTGMTATGSASGSYAGFSAKAGYRISDGMLFVTPYVGAGYLHTHRDAYTESGAGVLNLSYAAATYDIGTFSGGARLGADWQARPDLVVSPWIELGGILYTGNRNQNLTVTLGSVQQVLPAAGAPSSAGVVNVGVALMSTANWSAQLVYRGQFSSHTHMNTGDLKIVYRW